VVCVKPLAILLIEDNPGDSFLVEEALRTCAIPMDITVAEDGEKGLFLLTQGKVDPDLVILDLSIPKISGISVLQQYQPKEKPPVVVFSSTWGETDIRQALEFGAREVVHKPIDVRSFREAVCGIVRKWAPVTR
jgi:Response regulators consisting of a CheY-like receiver domain and a winged-helix DNA-binding domain